MATKPLQFNIFYLLSFPELITGNGFFHRSYTSGDGVGQYYGNYNGNGHGRGCNYQIDTQYLLMVYKSYV